MEWIEFNHEKYSQLLNENESSRLMVFCDNNKSYRYDEDWGFNVVTHFLVLPEPPKL